MKIKIILPLIAIATSLSFSSCTPTQSGAATGAAAGAAIGAIAADDGDRKKGALIGAGVGGAAGAVIGSTRNNQPQYYGPQPGYQHQPYRGY